MRLLESNPDKKGRSVSGALFSVILHVSIIFLAVFATARAGMNKAEKPKEEKVNFVAVKKDEPPPPPKKEEVKPKAEPPKPKKTPAPPKIEQPKVAAPAPPQGFKVVAPPVNVPTTMPAVDLSRAITNEADFSGKGVAGGSASGVKGGTGDADSKGKDAGEEHKGPYMEFQVEKAVEKIGGDSPDYPQMLRDQGVEGKVLAQFVVGANGRYEGGTLKILDSSNPAFTAAVKDALPRMRFSAAQIGGKKVAQLVQMPFQFNLKK